MKALGLGYAKEVSIMVCGSAHYCSMDPTLSFSIYLVEVNKSPIHWVPTKALFLHGPQVGPSIRFQMSKDLK